jgi:hypothetical protein
MKNLENVFGYVCEKIKLSAFVSGRGAIFFTQKGWIGIIFLEDKALW